jgi:hypothetical protein
VHILLRSGSCTPAWRSALLFSVVALAASGCRTDGLSQSVSSEAKPEPEVVRPESWVRHQSSPIFWSIWADVRDYVGEEKWAALDTSWMPARARRDLVTVTAKVKYADRYVLDGIWRLGLEREAVLRKLAEKEPEAEWPLSSSPRGVSAAWRPRLERWLRAQPKAIAESRLREELAVAWHEAIAARNPNLAGIVVAATEHWVGPDDTERLRPAAQDLARDALRELESRGRADWRDAGIGPGLLLLLERYGVPPGVDLSAVVTAAQRYCREMVDESIPLPHPYDLELLTLRVERLRDL